MIKPEPKTYKCPSCNWKKTVKPKSDALIQGIDWFGKCPKCGEKELKTSSASFIDIALQKVKDLSK